MGNIYKIISMQFTEHPINKSTADGKLDGHYRQFPRQEDCAHCILFVVDAGDVSTRDPHTENKLKDIQTFVRREFEGTHGYLYYAIFLLQFICSCCFITVISQVGFVTPPPPAFEEVSWGFF